MKEVAAEFNISTKTVGKIWSIAKTQMQAGLPVDVQCKWIGNSGKKRGTVDTQKMLAVPFHRRKNMRALAFAMDVSKSTVQRWLKSKDIRRHSNAIKPFLCEKGKLKRLKYCLDHITAPSIPINPTFHHFYDYIHIDEKWFNITKEKTTFYALPKEPDPYRTAQSKAHIPKIMFLAAVGRPRFGNDGAVLWDGKIGIFPFTFEAEAKRSSKNRPAGTLEVKATTTINRDEMKKMLLEKLLPAIKEKWPGPRRDVIIQQDNAKPHVDVNDPEFVQAAQEGDWNIKLQFQPPNSPDLNVLDLGYFRSIDTILDQAASRKLEDLITVVTTSFTALTPEKLNNVFLTCQSVMGEVLKQKGGNNFKIPHMGKSSLARLGRLPDNVGVSQEVYQEAKTFLEEHM